MCTVRCSGRGGVSAQGCVCLGGGVPGSCPGVCVPGGVVSQQALRQTPPPGQNSWHMLVKILPCCNFVADDNKTSVDQLTSEKAWYNHICGAQIDFTEVVLNSAYSYLSAYPNRVEISMTKQESIPVGCIPPAFVFFWGSAGPRGYGTTLPPLWTDRHV